MGRPSRSAGYHRAVAHPRSQAALALALLSACSTPAFEVREGSGHDDLWLGGRWVLREVHDPRPRGTPPLVRYHQQIVLPGGTDFVTRGEGPGLYPHHRGVFLGWNQTRHGSRTTDFWHCRNGARIVRESASARFASGALTRTATLAWIDGSGQTVLRESRRTRIEAEGEDVVVLDYDIELHATAGEVVLDGDAQHAGFHFRAADEVAARPEATAVVFAEGARELTDVPASAKGAAFADARWVAQRYTIAGRPCTVLHLDHPGNPRPTVYGVRAYGRFGAFPRVRLVPGAPVRLRYRLVVLALAAGEARAGAAALERRWQEYARAVVDPPRPGGSASP